MGDVHSAPSDRFDDETGDSGPSRRYFHESALIDHRLYLFGGTDGKIFFPRDEIWLFNIGDTKKWQCHRALGAKVPPPCIGAQCVVIDGTIYSYGGEKRGGGRLGSLFALDSTKLEWIEVSTPAEGKKPAERNDCCLCAIGSRLVMFGGMSKKWIPPDRLQTGASCDGPMGGMLGYANNEIYEFEFDDVDERERGIWLDLELNGKRPKRRWGASMAEIDDEKALFHGGYDGMNTLSDTVVIDLNLKTWTPVNFTPALLPRHGHTLGLLVKEKACFLLLGGVEGKDTASILNLNEKKSHQVDVDRNVARVRFHTAHCLQNDDSTADLVVCGGRNYRDDVKSILTVIRLAEVKLGKGELLLSRSTQQQQRAALELESRKREESLQLIINESIQQMAEKDSQMKELGVEILETKQQLTHSRQEKECLREQLHALEKSHAESQYHLKEAEKRLVNRENELAALKNELETTSSADVTILKRHLADKEARLEIMTTRCQNAEMSLAEVQKSLDEFIDVLSIKPEEVQLTGLKLGSGSYADVCVGRWQGISVAVKKFFDMITTPRSSGLFRREVQMCSRMHHPNIMTIYGAVMERGVPFQMVSELLEGSVEEVIDAAHTSDSYLTVFEQLYIAVGMTSGIAYLHQLSPRPYVHSDIRSSNVLVTQDMKVKVGDLGAAHLLASSKSVGPLSSQYLAPERMPRDDGAASHSTLKSDVFSLGVTLIEIFTGRAPIPAERQTQLRALGARDRLYGLCSKMIAADAASRPSARQCCESLNEDEEDELMKRNAGNGSSATPLGNRLVKSTFVRGKHKVLLSDTFF